MKKGKLKIGLVAPPWLCIPPRGYGGIELVVANLAEGLTKIGQEVLLFAPEDSVTTARIIPQVHQHLGQDWSAFAKNAFSLLSEKFSFARAAYEKVDIIHDHSLYQTELPVKAVYTIHGPATEEAKGICRKLSEQGHSIIAISERQKQLFGNGKIRFGGVVHNSIDASTAPYQDKKEDFIFFIGRANWEKGLDLAVRVAVKANKRLVMAIKMTEKFEQEFFAREVKPWLDKYKKNNYLTMFEVITPSDKFDLYRRASATIFSSQWEEPFGLVMIESMACGTPVIALRRGAAPEVIINGKTGFAVEDEEEMVEAVKKIDQINPKDCRSHVEKNFSVEKMCHEHLEIYKKVISGK
ncbi:MAG: glycosyltransferase family 4 protein [Candidatus Omnitrophota bacterium]|nr:MAG: glycosyltransferase family 4 protein [Candidatus Omnitrophota bacterium]